MTDKHTLSPTAARMLAALQAMEPVRGRRWHSFGRGAKVRLAAAEELRVAGLVNVTRYDSGAIEVVLVERTQVGFADDGSPVYIDEDRPVWPFDPTKARYKRFDEMAVGDVVCYFGQPRAEVLRLAYPYKETVGGATRAHWARALDGSGREGWLPYGPDGIAPVEIRRTP